MSFNDILFAIPIAISFCILVFKTVDILYKEEQCREKYQKTATTLFVIGLVGIIISQAIFNKQNSLNNRAVRFGLLAGSAMIIFYSVVHNWEMLDDITKLIIFGILFSVVIGWTYFASNNVKKIKNKKNKLNNSNDIDDDDLDDKEYHTKQINKKKQINKRVKFAIDDDDDDLDFDD
jgi:CDP-diglyceride synthetase